MPIMHGRRFASDSPGKRKTIDRDVLVSILESSPTRRDAKGYLQTYANKDGSKHHSHGLGEASSESSGHIGTTAAGYIQKQSVSVETPPHVAIVKLGHVDAADDATLTGIIKTLCQLQSLGLLCTIVADCGPNSPPSQLLEQAYRVSRLVDALGKHRSFVFRDIFSHSPSNSAGSGQIVRTLLVSKPDPLVEALSRRITLIIPPTCLHSDPLCLESIDPSKAVVALTKYFVNSDSLSTETSVDKGVERRIASVERIMILDPLGALPLAKRPGSCHRFVNLEQEFEDITKWLADVAHVAPTQSPPRSLRGVDALTPLNAVCHAENLKLARDTLEILPSASSVLITSHSAAAHISPPDWASDSKLTNTVKTRVTQNPLIHNLLIDKPIFSSSLPVRRIYPIDSQTHQQPIMATLVKRGMPLSIYPDPRLTPWTPPTSTSRSHRLTDPQIDLKRLTHLINDSFGRVLDLDHYLSRLDSNLAGVVIAGEYEGGAILTWESPLPPDGKLAAHAVQKYVPYLDKFAVLKSRQGSSGVADILFNAIVQDCFPDGLCWRSRHNNPVNKWYFERSLGSLRLDGSNWTMFWTTPDVRLGGQIVHDYEDVCRSVEPSWVDIDTKPAD
jgi:amino-acid N-acetyltransferase